MTTPVAYEPDYPYAPQDPRVPAPRPGPRPPRKIPWGFFWRWTRRLAVVGAIGTSLVLTVGSIIGYRAWRRAEVIAKLDRLGCLVVYAHEDYEYDEEENRIHELLRGWLGDEAWGRVTQVRADGAMRFFGGPLTADETDTICETCRQLGPLRSFSISSDSFRCEQIADWPRLEELEELSIHSKAIADDDLSRIGKLPKLRQLEVTAPKVTAAGLHHLAGLSKLESLTLCDVNLGGDGIANGPGFPNLKSLSIENATALSDDAIVSLGQLPALTDVVVGNAVGDRTISHLAGCQNLNVLILTGTRITDASLKIVAQFRSLTDVALDGAAITDEGLDALAGLELMSLSLNNTSVTDDGLARIAKLRSLEFLSLCDTRVTGVGMTHLKFAEPLGLSLDGAPLTPEGIAVLSKAKLSDLSVARTSFGDGDLMLFAGNDTIHHLCVIGTKVTAKGVRNFRQARVKRFATTGREDSLFLDSDFPDEMYLEPGAGMPFWGP